MRSHFPLRRVIKMEMIQTDKKVYEVAEIQTLLGIGRSCAYSFLLDVYEKREPFPVIKVGRLLKIPKKPSDKWLDGCD